MGFVATLRTAVIFFLPKMTRHKKRQEKAAPTHERTSLSSFKGFTPSTRTEPSKDTLVSRSAVFSRIALWSCFEIALTS